MQVIPLRPGPRIRANPRRGGVFVLDAAAACRSFDDIAADLDDPVGLAELRELATDCWDSDDRCAREYLDTVATATPEEWELMPSESHVPEFWRVLLASHLEPAPQLDELRSSRWVLERLGWHASDARRVTAGRPLAELPATFHSHHSLRLRVRLGTARGWMGLDDLTAALTHLRATPRRRFRSAPELVEPCEHLWSVLETASNAVTDESRVLLLASG